MGVTISDQRQNKGSLFLDDELDDCRKLLTNNNHLTEDFARFIKDGSWIDSLEGSNHFAMQTSTTKLKSIPVTFYSNAPVPYNHLSAKIQRQRSNSTHSLRSISSSSRDSAQTAIENFTEFYANIEEKTCFTPEQMLAFLIAIVYPLYHHTGERKAICERSESQSGQSEDLEAMLGANQMDEDVVHLQDMLLSTAAFFDEHDINTSLLTGDWTTTLNCAVNDCPLHVCICALDPTTNALHPVLINNVSRKRLHSMNKSHKHMELDFLQLWSIEGEELLQNEVEKCFRSATPMRLYAVQSADDTRTVLDVSYIFDSEGAQRYVLGVQMNIPEHGQSEKHLQYLHNTALIISHIVKTGNLESPAITACSTSSFR